MPKKRISPSKRLSKKYPDILVKDIMSKAQIVTITATAINPLIFTLLKKSF